MAVKIFALYLGMLLVTVGHGRVVPVASRALSEFGGHNSSRPNGDGFGAFAEVPQQFLQAAQQAAGQGLAAGQQAAGIFSSIMNAFLAAAMNAASSFSNLLPSAGPPPQQQQQQGRAAAAAAFQGPFPFPFVPLPFPVPLEPGPQLPAPAPAPAPATPHPPSVLTSIY